MKRILILLCLCLKIIACSSQNQSYVVRVKVDYVSMDEIFVISITAEEFEKLEYKGFCITNCDSIYTLQNILHGVQPVDSSHADIDMRRRITLFYSNGMQDNIFIGYFDFIYNNNVYPYNGKFRDYIESTIKKKSCKK